MRLNGSLSLYAVLVSIMMLAPAFSVPAQDARVEDIIVHVSAFSDGKTEKRLAFMAAGTDKSASLGIPNGARVASATMNITGLPYTTDGTDYPENVTVDVGNDGNLEWAFKGKGYGDLGKQDEFTSGGINATVSLGMNATNSTFFHMPQGAEILGANCTVKSLGGGGGDRTSIIGVGGSSNSYPFNMAAFRFQWLYQSQEVGRTGIVDKVAWKVSSGSGSATLTNFKMLLCSSSVTSLTTDFNSNYGGSAAQKVIDSPNYMISDSGGWVYIDPPNEFFYDNSNSKSLIIEVSFTARSGTGYTLVAGTESGASGNRRVWNSGDASASTGSVDGSCYRYDCQIDFISKFNMSVDFCNDAQVDYVNPATNWNNTDLSFAQPLSDFMAKAPLNFTDDYGIGFVTVPISVSTEFGGMVFFSNLSVTYQYTMLIDGSPTLGNLAEGLNAVIPGKYDGKTSNIPVAVFSGRSGKVRLSNVRIDFIPPVHPAIIESRMPEEPVVLMDENTTAEFCITAEDPYDYPMNTSWTVNGKTILKNSYNMSWYADFDANGTYNVTVSVDNQLQKVATSWMVIVKNVNRKPVIDSFSPDRKFEMDENSSATFELSASDPDNNAITFTWYADGKRVLSDETVYEYKTTYASAGKHEVKVAVLDVLGASTTLSWNVTVKDVNAGPVITDSSPPGDEVTMSENSSRKFGIVDLSPDLDKQFIQWSLDGNNTGVTGRSYNYSADYESAGTHIIQAEVTDGKLSEKRAWTVTVQDVNRAPVAVIASPAAKAEFMVGADIVLDGSTSSDPDGDALSASWSESSKPLGTGSTLTVKLAKGKHIITLGVDDGKKNGIATAQIEIYVRYIDFKATLTVDVAAPTEGKKVVVSAKLTNKGDGSIDELPVVFRVDGSEVSTTTIESIEPDADFPLEFQWKAVKGDHKLEVSVNNQNFSKTVTVAKKPAAVAPAGSDMTIWIALAVVAVIAAVAAVAVLGTRKKRAPVQPSEDEGYPEQRVDIPYQPLQEEAPAAVARTAPAHIPATPSPSHPAPAMTEEANAREAIDNTEKILQDAEKVGLDTKKARQSFKVARNFFDMGKFQKATLYCKTAEENIE